MPSRNPNMPALWVDQAGWIIKSVLTALSGVFQHFHPPLQIVPDNSVFTVPLDVTFIV